MRTTRLCVFVFVALVLGTIERARVVQPYPVAASEPRSNTDLHSGDRPLGAPQVRTPETVPGIPGQWPQQGKHRLVDATQLKSEARDLQVMTQALTPQIDQIGHG